MNAATVSVLSAAEEYAASGLPVFPLHAIRYGRCACGRDCGKPGKHPGSPHASLDATTDPETLRAWFGRHPDRGIAAATGARSGVFVVDVDAPAGFSTLAALELQHGAMPTTTTVATGRGGLHVWFRHPGGVRIPTRAGALGPSVDVRGDGGSIILPPTLHASGRRYAWLRGLDELADAPAWLLALVVERPRPPRPPLPPLDPSRGGRYAAAALAMEAARVAGAGAGARNSTTNAAAFNVGQLVGAGDLAGDHAAAVLVDAAILAGLPEREAYAAVRCGLRAGMASPRRRTSR